MGSSPHTLDTSSLSRRPTSHRKALAIAAKPRIFQSLSQPAQSGHSRSVEGTPNRDSAAPPVCSNSGITAGGLAELDIHSPLLEHATVPARLDGCRIRDGGPYITSKRSETRHADHQPCNLQGLFPFSHKCVRPKTILISGCKLQLYLCRRLPLDAPKFVLKERFFCTSHIRNIDKIITPF
jgi:hypothetical protein